MRESLAMSLYILLSTLFFGGFAGFGFDVQS